MTNEEILYGLKAALERGQTLNSAMLSFFNAGYERAEIEEAAMALAQVPENIIPTKKPEKPVLPIAPVSSPPKVSTPVQPVIKPKEDISEKVPQKASNYGEKKNNKLSTLNKFIIVILVILLLILISSVIAIFIFKDQIISWLNSIF
jgi:hypothetical protein